MLAKGEDTLEMELARARVEKALSQYEDLQVITFAVDTSTSELAAKALNVAVGQIAKSLCFLGDGEPFLVVSVGDKKMDSKKLAKALNKKKIKFADAQKVFDCTGFLPGGVCPFALQEDIPIYLDQSLWQYEVVYAAAGTSDTAVPIKPQYLLEITKGQLIDATID